MRVVLLAAIVASVFMLGAHAHSWVACTKYLAESRGFDSYDEGVQDEIYYNDDICVGYPRNWGPNNFPFAKDTGSNFEGSEPCGSQHAGFTSAYSSEYPMATYYVGERVCLSWPAKNHAATDQASCASRGGTATNEYIPDNGIRLFYSGPNNVADPATQADFEMNEILPFGRGTHTGGTVDMMGFQNCPGFCEGNDGAMCNGCFDVPNLTPGTYQFQWWWEFNPGSIYKSCFDAVIEVGSTTGVQPGSTGSATTGSATTGSATGSDPCVGVTCSNQGFCNGGSCICNSGYGGTDCSDVITTNPNPPPPTLGGDSIRVNKFPTIVPTRNVLAQFDCVIDYNAKGDRQIIIDVLDASDNFAFYGRGDLSVTAGEGSITVQVVYQKNAPAGEDYILKAWIVDKTIYEQDSAPWAYELDKIEWGLSISDTATEAFYPGVGATTDAILDTDDSSTGAIQSAVSVLAVFVALCITTA